MLLLWRDTGAHSLSSSIAQPGRTQGAPLPTQKLVSAISTGKHNPFQHATLQVLYNTTIRLEQLEATACMYKSSISIGTTQRHEIPIIEAARHTGEAKCRNHVPCQGFPRLPRLPRLPKLPRHLEKQSHDVEGPRPCPRPPGSAQRLAYNGTAMAHNSYVPALPRY